MYEDLFDVREMKWMADAPCQNLPTEWFFPVHTHEDGRIKGPDSYSRARSICSTCLVSRDCLWYAIHHHIEWGMWGGLSPDERESFCRKLRRRR